MMQGRSIKHVFYQLLTLEDINSAQMSIVIVGVVEYYKRGERCTCLVTN